MAEKTIDDYMKSVSENLDRVAKINAEAAEEFKKREVRFEKMLIKFAKDAEKRQAEYDAAAAKRQAEYDAAAAKRQAEYDEKAEKRRNEDAIEAKKRQEEFDNDLKKINKAWGSHTNNLGDIAEEYFFNSFKKGQKNFFGEKFDEIQNNVKVVGYGCDDEYDILLINGSSIAIIEVKHKAHHDDIPDIIKKAQTLRVNISTYKNHKIYLGFASNSFYKKVENECKKNGIAIIKQAGDTMIMNEENIKIY